MRDYGARGALALWCFTLVTPSMSQMDDGGRSGFLRGNPTARTLMTSSIDTTVSIVGVGIYLPDDAADVLSTSTDNELVEELEDDDRVTVQSIQLGALLCDSLVNAENAEMLGFSLSPGETFFANRTSYTVHNGSIFSDGISRKVWTGSVINDQEEVSSQTASMTWGEQCDVETFLLEVPKRFVNGTLIVAKTLPCLEGGELDICIVELEIDLPDEGESELEDTEGDTRQLRDRQDLDLHVNTTGGAIAPVERHLQSTTTQIDLMFFYTPEARNNLLVSDSQMQSVLADSVTTVNEAMINSNIDLQFFLVRVEPIPYTEESTESSVVLENLQASSEVAELRDTYGADLVHLVTDLEGGCGRANLAAEPNEDAAFGVVDPYCFFQFSHTHEIAHNMGCYHDRDTSFTQHEYAHGYRYCDGDLPYRTIMSYACWDENGQRIPRENYFSNPDVIFNGKPTGTLENNCARRLTETMGDVANYRESITVATTPAPTTPITPAPTAPITPAPTTPTTPAPTTPTTPAPTAPITPTPTTPITPAPTAPITPAPTAPITPAPATPIILAPMAQITPAPTTPITPAPTTPITSAPTTPITPAPTAPITPAPTAPITPAPATPIILAPTAQITPAPTAPITPAPTTPITPVPTAPITLAPTIPITPAPTTPITPGPTIEITSAPTAPITPGPTTPITPGLTTEITSAPTGPTTEITSAPTGPTTLITPAPTAPITLAPTIPITPAPTLAPAINVVTVPTSTAPTTGPTTCSNGITGVERNGYCCPVGCGTCGGYGCSQRAKEAGLPSGDCCVSRIEESGIYCDNSGTAPCIFGAAPTPTLGSVTPVPTSVVPTAALDSPTPMTSSLPPSAAPKSATPSPSSLAPTAAMDSATPMPSSLPPSAAPESATLSPTSLAPSAAMDSTTPMSSSLPPSAASESVISSSSSLAPTAGLEPGVSQPVATPTMAEFVEVGERTTVVVSANAFDERIPDSGCAPDGCVEANTRDGSLDTRWSCKESLLGGANCEITYEFGEPQDLDMIRIAFYKGAERTRRLKIKINGFNVSEVESSGQIDDFEDFVLGVSGASEVVLEALGLGSHEWISLTEVQFILP